MTSPSRFPTTEEINELERLHKVAALIVHQGVMATEEAAAYERKLKARMPLPLLEQLEDQDKWMRDGGN